MRCKRLITMRFAWTHIFFALLSIASSLASKSNHRLQSERKAEEVEDSSNQDALIELDDELKDLEYRLKDELSNGDLPILPPLILLDFTNGTNSTDDKFKRTINGNLGYGFQGNNLLAGKYNYYFPAGKSGTTVSIEESISPFLPKTIIERVKPITEEPENSNNSDGDKGENKYFTKNAVTSSTVQNHRVPFSDHQYEHTRAIFGQRTKLQKTTSDFGSFSGFSTTPKTHLSFHTTESPDLKLSTAFGSYNSFSSTPRPTYQPVYESTNKPNAYSSGVSYPSSTTESPLNDEYSTSAPSDHQQITPAAYHANYNFDPYSSQRTILEPASKLKQTESTADYYSASMEALSNYPRYTVENGVRYEHKIVWKYPDGRVSDTPPSPPPSPTSYINSYSEYLSQKPAPAVNYENIRYNSRPNYQQQHQKQQQQKYNLKSQSIYSQKPAQFPKQESEDQNANQFVSSASYSQQSTNYGPGSSEASLPYEVVYQNPYSTKQNPRNGVHGFSPARYHFGQQSGQRNPYHFQESRRPVPKYAVNSPNPDYVATTENTAKSDSTESSKLFTSSGHLSSSVLSKYTPDAQRYLSKVFAPGKNPITNSYGENVDPQYADLLKYNPSISQYIKNPSSILNAQPTFVQAGNSLIPVIILRVDGAPPVQSKATPNINLKALLQQYLTQYAQSLSEMTQDSSHDLGKDYYAKSQASRGSNPISELTQLTKSLSQFSQNPTIATEYQTRFSQNGEYDRRQYEPSGYVPILKQGRRQQQNEEDRIIETVNRYTMQGKQPQKVKSVEIIDDPRYTSYKSS
ncbi:uncharacterized protein LOC117168384 [Belonocnema kinseyi]|uniref:uncharacterized protein LOC117168384 n=1 Tax=Belonocnema kinseyi TaxID=2817044 RepID=UPI00143DF11A|nr:uncharacterized protein LOC117168384 [Belonocnema kinseyi]